MDPNQQAVVVEVAPSPKSISYNPASKGSWIGVLSVIFTVILLSPAGLIAITKQRSEYLGTGAYNNLFMASVCTAGCFILFHLIWVAMRMMTVFIHRINSFAYINERELKRIERAPALRFYLSTAIALTALVISSSALVCSDISLETNTPLLARTWEYFYLRFVQLVTITAWLLFVEKYFIQKIAVFFHSRFYAKRLQTNEFVLNCISRLRLLFVSRRSISPESSGEAFSFIASKKEYGSMEDAQELTEAIFTGLSIPAERDYLTVHDLETAFQTEAGHFIECMDIDANGQLGKKEFQIGIIGAYEECELLETSLISNSRVISRLERMIMILLTVVIFYIFLSMLMSSVLQTISVLGAGILAANFLFADEVSCMFSGIIFVIITHPFDIGDAITIDGKPFRVRDIDLTLTTLQGPGGRFTYISNSVLAGSKIGNMRRSGNMHECFKLSLESSINRQQLEAFQKDLDGFIKEHPRDYEGRVHLGHFAILSSKSLEFEVKVGHRANFQDGKVRGRRSRQLVNAMRTFLAKQNLKLAEFSWEQFMHHD